MIVDRHSVAIHAAMNFPARMRLLSLGARLRKAFRPSRIAKLGKKARNGLTIALNKRRYDAQVLGFICGSGHSGTSLIANILAGHDDVWMPLYETGIFLHRHINMTYKHRKLRLSAVRAGRRVILEKTPRHIHAMDVIRGHLPRPRFLIVVRDGRDVAASMARRFGDVRVGIDRWIEDNTLAMAERDAEDVIICRYEDFIEDPEAALKRICAFFDLPYTRALLDYHKQPRLWFREQELKQGRGRSDSDLKAHRNWQINQPLFDGRNRWQAELDAESVAELTSGRGRQVMEALGYLKSTRSPQRAPTDLAAS